MPAPRMIAPDRRYRHTNTVQHVALESAARLPWRAAWLIIALGSTAGWTAILALSL